MTELFVIAILQGLAILALSVNQLRMQMKLNNFSRLAENLDCRVSVLEEKQYIEVPWGVP